MPDSEQQTTPATRITTPRQFEQWLRENGWSRRAARSICAHGFKPQNADEQAEVDDEIIDLLQAIAEKIDLTLALRNIEE